MSHLLSNFWIDGRIMRSKYLDFFLSQNTLNYALFISYFAYNDCVKIVIEDIFFLYQRRKLSIYIITIGDYSNNLTLRCAFKRAHQHRIQKKTFIERQGRYLRMKNNLSTFDTTKCVEWL